MEPLNEPPTETIYTRRTPLGVSGTRLVFRYIAQVVLTVLLTLIQTFDPFSLVLAILGTASIIAIFTRKPIALYFTYSYLALLLLAGVRKAVEFVMASDRRAVGGNLTGALLIGVVSSVVWFAYFHRRKGLFGAS